MTLVTNNARNLTFAPNIVTCHDRCQSPPCHRHMAVIALLWRGRSAGASIWIPGGPARPAGRPPTARVSLIFSAAGHTYDGIGGLRAACIEGRRRHRCRTSLQSHAAKCSCVVASSSTGNCGREDSAQVSALAVGRHQLPAR